jgi:hypothetical protein
MRNRTSLREIRRGGVEVGQIPERPDRRLRSVVHVDLAQQPFEVNLHRSFSHAQMNWSGCVVRLPNRRPAPRRSCSKRAGKPPRRLNEKRSSRRVGLAAKPKSDAALRSSPSGISRPAKRGTSTSWRGYRHG